MRAALAGRSALICAASKGLGRACAEALGRAGAAVMLSSRGGEALETTAASLRGEGIRAESVAADLRVSKEIDALVDRTVSTFGSLDILVTNTGGPPSGPFTGFDDEVWNQQIASILLSVVRLARAAVPHMKSRGGGRILNITSISAKQPIDGLVLSNTLRAAVTALAKTLAAELAPDNILVNCVAPGYTRTDRVVDLARAAAAREGLTLEEVERRTVAGIPMGRMGTAEEFAAVVRFLASPEASYVTGTTIQVDGGWTRGL